LGIGELKNLAVPEERVAVAPNYVVSIGKEEDERHEDY
jgi:hypothetical protein